MKVTVDAPDIGEDAVEREQLEEWLDAYCNRDGTERVLTGKILDYISATNTALTASQQRVTQLEAIVSRDDTKVSYKCAVCGAWHMRVVKSALPPAPNDEPGYAQRAGILAKEGK